jgi:hypothetical protein
MLGSEFGADGEATVASNPDQRFCAVRIQSQSQSQ